ncbi:MAG: hypothetical protein ACREOO_05695 [bacterium]
MNGKSREAEEIVVRQGGEGDHDHGGPTKKPTGKDYVPDEYRPDDYQPDVYRPNYPSDYSAYPPIFPSDYPTEYPQGYPLPYPTPPKYPQDYYKQKGYPKGVFETPIPAPGLFDGEIYASVYELGGAAPANIIRLSQTWGVLVKWKTSGCLVRMICGEWCVKIHLESMGPGPELTLPRGPAHIPLTPCDAKDKHVIYYKYNLVVPPGVIDARHCSTPYKLVTTLTYFDECKTPGPIAAHVEGPILQFYMPKKY